MSPHLIIILMLSSVALLLVLLFAIRKRTKNAAQKTTEQAQPSSPDQTVLPLQKAQDSPTSTSTPDIDLSSLDLSGISFTETSQSSHHPNELNEPNKPSPLDDIIDMVDRYKFFQGKNLETFSTLLRTNNLDGIETMIREKFEAQKKENAELLAKEVTTKLIGTAI